MTNKDLRRIAREKWKKFWPIILVAFVLLFSVYIALAMSFSFVLSPFLLNSFLPGIEELRRGISLSISGILLALLVFVLAMYLIVTSFSILYMALKSIRGQKLSPFDIFYTLRPENYPMQLRILGYSFIYTFVPWFFSALVFVLFGFTTNDPILSMAHELLLNLWIGFFLLFFLCTPFLILEEKSLSLFAAMKKSAEMMKSERSRFFRHVLYFLGLRVGANVIAEMWSFILNNSLLPSFFLMFFFLLFLSPYYILVQAAFYQDILSRREMQNKGPELNSEIERKEETEVGTVEDYEVHGEELKEQSEYNEDEFGQAEEEAKGYPAVEKKEEPETQMIVDRKEEPVVEDQEEPSNKNNEETKEKLSFEEARKRYTDYKEDEES